MQHTPPTVSALITAIDIFKTLVYFDRDDYGDFKTTKVGYDYHDEVHQFCMGHDDLSIPDLGIEFAVLDYTRTNVENCEGKLDYDLNVTFRDEATGKLYVLSTAIYKATDIYVGAMSLNEAPAEKPTSSEKTASPLAAPKVAAMLVQKMGECFTVQGRELCVDDPMWDVIFSGYVGKTFDFEEYHFQVTENSRVATSMSDAWSLGNGFVELTEVSKNFKVTIRTDLFEGQTTEVRSVTIMCGAASFDLDANS